MKDDMSDISEVSIPVPAFSIRVHVKGLRKFRVKLFVLSKLFWIAGKIYPIEVIFEAEELLV